MTAGRESTDRIYDLYGSHVRVQESSLDDGAVRVAVTHANGDGAGAHLDARGARRVRAALDTWLDEHGHYDLPGGRESPVAWARRIERQRWAAVARDVLMDYLSDACEHPPGECRCSANRLAQLVNEAQQT